MGRGDLQDSIKTLAEACNPGQFLTALVWPLFKGSRIFLPRSAARSPARRSLAS